MTPFLHGHGNAVYPHLEPRACRIAFRFSRRRPAELSDLGVAQNFPELGQTAGFSLFHLQAVILVHLAVRQKWVP